MALYIAFSQGRVLLHLQPYQYHVLSSHMVLTRNFPEVCLGVPQSSAKHIWKAQGRGKLLPENNPTTF